MLYIFKLSNSLNRDYNDTDYIFDSVEFYKDYYRCSPQVIYFNNFLTEKEAILKVIDYLSQPVSEQYFYEIKDNTNYSNNSYNEIIQKAMNRGFLLGEKNSVTSIVYRVNGRLSVNFGAEIKKHVPLLKDDGGILIYIYESVESEK